jgi:hypothetical protein
VKESAVNAISFYGGGSPVSIRPPVSNRSYKNETAGLVQGETF